PRTRSQELERRAVIGLGGGDLDLAQLLRQTKELPAATARDRVSTHRVRKPEQADLIALRDRDVAEHERGVHRVIELGEATQRARHHTARIEEDLYALLSLGLVLHGDRATASRRRRPRDRTRVVIRDVLTQALEDRT